MEDENSLSFCKDCQMMCSNLSSFKKHVRKRHPTKFQQLFPPKNDSSSKYMCDDCGQTFNTNRSLNGHKKTSHSEPEKSTTTQGRNSYKRKTIKDESIECSDCEIEFDDLVTFKQHMRDHRDNRIVKVKKETKENSVDQAISSGNKKRRQSSTNRAVKSEKVCCTPDISQETENTETSVRKSSRVRKRISYAQLVMSSSDSENETLAVKIETRKKSTKMHVCNECHMEYEDQSDLTKHIRKHHPSKLDKKSKPGRTWKQVKLVDKKQSCSDCSTTYNNLSCLRKHVRRYHPTKWAELAPTLYNRRKRNSENSYSCTECLTIYGNVVGFRKHIRKYHPSKFNEMAAKLYKKTPKNVEKVLSCPECEVRYCAMPSLRKHIKKEHPTKISELISKISEKESENSKRVIACTECDMKYSNMSALRKHTRKHHPNKLLELAPKLYTFKRNLAKNILLKGENSKASENLLDGELVDMYKYMCNVCQSSYSNISNLRKHLRKFHPEILSDVAPLLKDYTNFKYLCDLCPKKFNCVRNFKYHQRKCHPEFAQPCKRTQKRIKPNKCPLCDFEDTERKKLLEHFKDKHDIEVSMSPVDVHNLDEFSKWKESFEEATNARFVKEYHFSCMSHDVVSYICHRSGYYNPKGKGLRHMKAQGSSKINGYCPAAIKLKKIKDGTVKVTFCGTHIGHTTDVTHLHLTAAERQIIAEKIAMNIPFKDILDSMKDSVSESDFKRIHMLSKKDLYNIKSSFHLSSPVAKTPKPPAENVAFETWIEDTKKNGDCIMFHKPQGRTIEEHPTLKPEDFVLMIMNQTQRDKLRKFGHESVCVDRSFDLNSHQFELVSLLVLNENEEGYPCAFLISNRSDLEIMTLFFHFIKVNAGCVEAKVFMSDMVDYFYTAWVTVMSNVQMRFHCTWLVEHAWRKKIVLIKSKEKQEIVMGQLKVILEEKDISSFKIMLESMVNQLGSEMYAWNFSNYLNDNYLQKDELWPSADCVFTDVKFNQHFERMHKTLNHLFLNGKNAKHFGKALGDIMRFMREKLFDRTILINRGKINNKMKIAIFRHKLSLHSETNSIVTTEEGWQIPSTETSEIYTIKEIPVACRCEFICPECKCCIHKYLCSCLDSYVKWNMCKHIHLLCRHLNSLETTKVQSVNDVKPRENYEKEQTQQILYVKGAQVEYVKHQTPQVEYIKQPLQIEYVEQPQQVEYIKQAAGEQYEVIKQAQQVDFDKQATQMDNLQVHHIQMQNQVVQGGSVENTYIYCNETNQREMDAILAQVNICNLETVQVTQIPTSCTIQIPTSCTVVPQVAQIATEPFGEVVDTKESLKMRFLKLLEEASSPSELEVVQKMLASITPTLEVIKGTTNHQVLFPL
ncbi:uncharacterized protein LOC123319303 [Coccinella septempunctata]|uniref:uncharacterized protein LOC123319303 n=1 Tax=Coccinella septempunctata TaxID=41139 RepID=UPI001D0777BA|nr:uncharacterized protein LOC123319303 [Coccinella septempunctata]